MNIFKNVFSIINLSLILCAALMFGCVEEKTEPSQADKSVEIFSGKWTSLPEDYDHVLKRYQATAPEQYKENGQPIHNVCYGKNIKIPRTDLIAAITTFHVKPDPGTKLFGCNISIEFEEKKDYIATLSRLVVPLSYVDAELAKKDIGEIISVVDNTVIFDLGKSQFEFTFKQEK